MTPRPVTWLSEEEQAWRAKCRAVAADVVGPHVAEMDRAARIAPEVLSGLRDAGVLAIEVPEAYGGSGRTLFDAVLAIEEVSGVDPAVAVLVDVQNMLAISALLRHGSGEQRRRLLPRLATGTVGAYALSEEQSGSDAFAVATEAVRDGAGYRLTGVKKGPSSARQTALLEVHAAVADAALGHATAYAADRHQFGHAIGSYQGVAFPLAQLAAELDAARTVLYDTARLLQHGGTAGERLRCTAVAKLLASQVAERAAAQAVETLGGNGFVTASGVEKLYRDAKVGKIYEGTSNMQYRTIAATRGGGAS